MIAFYVHHHGSGHLHRALAIAGELGEKSVGMSTLPAPPGWPGRWLVLPDDAGDVDQRRDDVTAGSTLHWVPRHHDGLRERMARISSELRDREIRLLVSDVSVEVSLLARLHGVPVAVVAQPGERTDRAHRTAYDLAEVIIAPWPRRPAPDWPEAWLAKTVHVGALSRFDRRPRKQAVDGPTVLVLWGAGGLAVSPAQLRAAAAATPDWQWSVAGPGEPTELQAPNLRHHGWMADPWPVLGEAGVVITHAGQNALAEIAAAGRPAVVIPQPRPFHEQRATAAALIRARLGVVVPSWPEPHRWPSLLTRARTRGGDWTPWSSGDGAIQAAVALREVAGKR
ncbi:glycosyltransferase [Amycolatopsis azurea]|uniref:glycosyltransferase n=1 Tax=Amycolatopsis azurea TaxID=36819 RepID=UPI0037F8D053